MIIRIQDGVQLSTYSTRALLHEYFVAMSTDEYVSFWFWVKFHL